MIESEKTPKWAKRPDEGCDCKICGHPIYSSDEYEVVKTKGAKRPSFYHTSCTKKERAERW